MAAYLEVSRSTGSQHVPLDKDRVTVGQDASNDVALEDDETVSHLHAVLEEYPAGWSVKDLGSRNGTFVNGRRLWADQRLRAGDEIRVGSTKMVFRHPDRAATVTAAATAALPEITRRERDVLLALCRPMLSGHVFTEPASIRQIAHALVVSEDAIKQHLVRLYDKFGLTTDESERRRVRLANEAIGRGAVTLADLRSWTPAAEKAR
jgi:hypothetical protein